MNTERTEKFVNAIACDLEEGGFRQVSGTTLRRTLATAVSAALPLLADTGIPASQPAELAEQQGVDFDIDDVRELFEQWAKGRNLTPDTWGVSAYVCPCVDNDFDVWRAAWKALAATGKQQVGEVQGDALVHAKTLDLLRAGYHVDSAQRTAALDAGIAALAARQPETYHGDVDLKWLAGTIGEVAHRLRTYMPNLAEWADRARHCGIAAKVLEKFASRQPGAQEPVDFYVCDTCGHYYMENGVTCDCTALAKQPPLRHVRMVAAPPAQGIDLGRVQALIEKWEAIADKHGVRQFTGNDHRLFANELRVAIGQRDAAPGVGNG